MACEGDEIEYGGQKVQYSAEDALACCYSDFTFCHF